MAIELELKNILFEHLHLTHCNAILFHKVFLVVANCKYLY